MYMGSDFRQTVEFKLGKWGSKKLMDSTRVVRPMIWISWGSQSVVSVEVK